MKDRSDDPLSGSEKSKTASILNKKSKQECYLIRQLSFSSIGQDNSKLHKQISKLLILFEIAA